MILQCPQCKTQYKLDDAKLKPGETKVRCSRCQHLFVVPHPLGLKEEEIFGEVEQKPADAFLKEWAKEAPVSTPQAPTPVIPPPSQPPRRELPLFVEELPDEEPEPAPIPSRAAIPPQLRPTPVPPFPKKGRQISTSFILSMVLLLSVAGAFYYWSRVGQSIPAFEYVYLKIYNLMEGKKGELLIPISLKGTEYTLEGGKVYVIQGKVANRSPETKAVVRLKGSLYDKAGRVVATSNGVCGVTLSEEEIQKSTYESLKASFGFVAVGQAKPVAPEESAPFTIIFFSPPEDAAYFAVVIAEPEG